MFEHSFRDGFMRRALGVLMGIAALPCLVSPAQSQIRASERGSITQTIDGTTITVDYARPRTRGRAAVFGGEVHWKEVWTPGANMATTLEVSKNQRSALAQRS